MSELFVKKLSEHFSYNEIIQIYDNTERYYSAALNIEGVEMPKPLSFDETSITFAYVENLSPKVSELWFKGQCWDNMLCHKLGATLGALHYSQNSDLSSDIYLYGDYVPHNIVYRNRKLTLFDVEPPMYRQSFSQFYRGRNYVDIVSMLLFMFIGHSFKRPWNFFRNKQPLVQAYMSGYTETAGFSIDKRQLNFYLKKQLDFWYFDRGRKHGWMVKNLKYGFVCLVLFVQKYVYKAV